MEFFGDSIRADASVYRFLSPLRLYLGLRRRRKTEVRGYGYEAWVIGHGYGIRKMFIEVFDTTTWIYEYGK